MNINSSICIAEKLFHLVAGLLRDRVPKRNTCHMNPTAIHNQLRFLNHINIFAMLRVTTYRKEILGHERA